MTNNYKLDGPPDTYKGFALEAGEEVMTVVTNAKTGKVYFAGACHVCSASCSCRTPGLDYVWYEESAKIDSSDCMGALKKIEYNHEVDKGGYFIARNRAERRAGRRLEHDRRRQGYIFQGRSEKPRS